MAAPVRRSPLALALFGLALLGVLVVVHLHFQKQAEFAFGCTGTEAFDASAALSGGTAAGCATVTFSEWATFLGLDNVVWGLLFYGLVAALRLAFGATGDDRLRLASFGVVAVGFLYTLRLVYIQAVELDAFCALCMTSAAIVTALLVLHVMEHLRVRGATPPPPGKPARAVPPAARLRPYLAVAAVFAVLLAADYAVAGRRAGDAPPATAERTDAERPATPAGEQPPPPPPDAATLAAQCGYDEAVPPVADLAAIIDGAPAVGEEGAPVTVVEIFDPNCPHCKDLYAAIHGTGFATERGAQARFYSVPFPLWDFSLGQVAALRLAREEGRYDALIEQLFARQGGRGMNLDQVLAAAEAAGMNAPELRRKLTDNATLDPLLQRILDHRQAVVSAVTPDGSMSVPKVLINGRLVAATTAAYTPECFDRLITEAAGAPAAAD